MPCSSRGNDHTDVSCPARRGKGSWRRCRQPPAKTRRSLPSLSALRRPAQSGTPTASLRHAARARRRPAPRTEPAGASASVGSWPGASCAEENCQRTVGVGDDESAAAQARSFAASTETLLGAAHANTERAVDGVGVQRPNRHGGIDQADREDVGEQALGEKAAFEHPLEHRRLDRRPGHVRVETDVAKEDPVGGRESALDGRSPRALRASGWTVRASVPIPRAASCR